VSHGPQPGQYGAYFEVRTVRVWWAPWRRRRIWQQVSAWTPGLPPASGVEVITVSDPSDVDGKVRTIGTVTPGGAVVY